VFGGFSIFLQFKDEETQRIDLLIKDLIIHTHNNQETISGGTFSTLILLIELTFKLIKNYTMGDGNMAQVA
jgi:hypothetical protein